MREEELDQGTGADRRDMTEFSRGAFAHDNLHLQSPSDLIRLRTRSEASSLPSSLLLHAWKGEGTCHFTCSIVFGD